MKALDIAMRDLLRSFRSFFAIVFMFFVPLMTVGLLFLAFGGLGSDDSEESTLPKTSVDIVNLDQSGDQAFAAGDFLVDFLTGDELSDLLVAAEMDDEALVRQKVSSGEVAVAVIIPENLTEALFSESGMARVEIIHDPTLTVGPSIVESIVSQVLDSFNSSQVAFTIVIDDMLQSGITPDPAVIENISYRYSAWLNEQGEALRDGNSAYASIQPAAGETEPEDMMTSIVSSIMAAMMVFFSFFTGSVVAQSTIKEQEEGTLKRLFTTPLTSSTFLVGKIIGSLLTLVIQIVILIVFSSIFFGVEWGRPVPVILASIGLIAMSSSFGIFLMSLVRSSNQVGIIYGGVMTITGIFGTYAYFLPIAEEIARYAKVVPQGWAMNSLDIAMKSGPVSGDLLISVGVSLGLSVIFFLIGTLRFQRRFVIE